MEIKVKHLMVVLIYIPLFMYAQYLAYVYNNEIQILTEKSSLWDYITYIIGAAVYIIDWAITIFLVVWLVILLFSFIYEHKEKALLKIGSLPDHKKHSKDINLVELAEPGDDIELLKRIEERLNT